MYEEGHRQYSSQLLIEHLLNEQIDLWEFYAVTRASREVSASIAKAFQEAFFWAILKMEATRAFETSASWMYTCICTALTSQEYSNFHHHVRIPTSSTVTE